MTITTTPRPSDVRRIAGTVILLLAGVLFGLISVYSKHPRRLRALGCARLIATFASGLLAAHVRTRR